MIYLHLCLVCGQLIRQLSDDWFSGKEQKATLVASDLFLKTARQCKSVAYSVVLWNINSRFQ